MNALLLSINGKKKNKSRIPLFSNPKSKGKKAKDAPKTQPLEVHPQYFQSSLRNGVKGSISYPGCIKQGLVPGPYRIICMGLNRYDLDPGHVRVGLCTKFM